MRNITIWIYLLAALLQLFAFIVAIRQTKKVISYKSGWVLLSFGLLLMLFRRAHPIYIVLTGGSYLISDAIFALVISFFLLSGLLMLRSLFDLLQSQEQQFERQARYDSLTGVLSRVAILEQAGIAMERCIRLKRPIAILLLDMDKFKYINDHYGHAAGDQVLKDFVLSCKKSLRNIDLFGRLGGDEFLAILSETNLDIVLTIAERLIYEIKTTQSIFEQNPIEVKASVGVAMFEPEYLSKQQAISPIELVNQLIKIADVNMYIAKRSEGNKIHYSPLKPNAATLMEKSQVQV